MLTNYLKIALRNLLKNINSTLINIIGLSAGLTCCLLMVLYMQHELSYDKFITNSHRIVRVIMEFRLDDRNLIKANYTSSKVLPSFRKNFAEVEDGVRMMQGSRIVKYKDQIFNESKFLFADSSFFKVFSFPLLRGNAETVLEEPKTVVLSKSAAYKYFGETDPVGKTLLLGSNQDPYLITGVAEDCPSNSQIKFDFLASFSSLGKAQEDTYFDANFTTYFLVSSKEAIAGLQQKIGPFMENELKSGYKAGTYMNFILEPYTRVHLYSEHDGFEPNSNITYIYFIAAIALLVLAVACFTYINLSAAQSLSRAREVGIRKVSGAFHGQVFWQFIGESALMTFGVTVISFGIAALVLPQFNELTGKNLQVESLFQPSILLTALVMVVTVSLLAGSYPALILARFQAITVLKGAFKNTESGTWVRKSLIVFQFSIAVFLIVATFIIQKQMQFIQNKKLGFEKEHILVMNVDQKIIEKLDLVKTVLKENPEIRFVSKANFSPVEIVSSYHISKSNQEGADVMNVMANPIDDEYIRATNLEILRGEDFTRQDVLDANQKETKTNFYHFILNETAVKMMGWKLDEAVGQKMFMGNHRPGEVKAVVKDFHFADLHKPIEPLVLFPEIGGGVLLIKMTGKNVQETIADIGKKWQALAPHRPFDYHFMDEDFAELYQSEARTQKVFSIFSSIAVLLACLGLFGLSSYTAHQRIKEIGIRKVLGASVSNIVVLLSNSFIQLICVAFLIAAPLTWFIMNTWLQEFAYRVELSWTIFVAAAGRILVVTMLTLSFQAIRAAIANPVNALKTE